MEVFTIGFTKKTAAEFFGLLKAAGMKRLLRVGHAVVVVSELGLAIMGLRHDVIDRTRIFDSQGPNHTGRLPSPIHIFKPDPLPSLLFLLMAG